MRLWLKGFHLPALKGGRRELVVDDDRCVRSVKEAAARICNVDGFAVDIDELDLVYGGSILQDADSISTCNLQTGATVHLTRRKRTNIVAEYAKRELPDNEQAVPQTARHSSHCPVHGPMVPFHMHNPQCPVHGDRFHDHSDLWHRNDTLHGNEHSDEPGNNGRHHVHHQPGCVHYHAPVDHPHVHECPVHHQQEASHSMSSGGHYAHHAPGNAVGDEPLHHSHHNDPGQHQRFHHHGHAGEHDHVHVNSPGDHRHSHPPSGDYHDHQHCHHHHTHADSDIPSHSHQSHLNNLRHPRRGHQHVIGHHHDRRTWEIHSHGRSHQHHPNQVHHAHHNHPQMHDRHARQGPHHPMHHHGPCHDAQQGLRQLVHQGLHHHTQPHLHQGQPQSGHGDVHHVHSSSHRHHHQMHPGQLNHPSQHHHQHHPTHAYRQHAHTHPNHHRLPFHSHHHADHSSHAHHHMTGASAASLHQLLHQLQLSGEASRVVITDQPHQQASVSAPHVDQPVARSVELLHSSRNSSTQQPLAQEQRGVRSVEHRAPQPEEWDLEIELD